jgi:hypothetical protein
MKSPEPCPPALGTRHRCFPLPFADRDYMTQPRRQGGSDSPKTAAGVATCLWAIAGWSRLSVGSEWSDTCCHQAAGRFLRTRVTYPPLAFLPSTPWPNASTNPAR